jgi:hypothetical protein
MTEPAITPELVAKHNLTPDFGSVLSHFEIEVCFCHELHDTGS